VPVRDAAVAAAPGHVILDDEKDRLVVRELDAVIHQTEASGDGGLIPVDGQSTRDVHRREVGPVLDLVLDGNAVAFFLVRANISPDELMPAVDHHVGNSVDTVTSRPGRG